MSNQEYVSVSFHFIERSRDDKHGNPELVPFSLEEFRDFVGRIDELEVPDPKDPTVLAGMRIGTVVPFHFCEFLQNQDRLAFGAFEGTYVTHSFQNTAVGKVPADSVSLRKFYFLLYLSESGRIYVGCQYLGNYGAYSQLQKGLKKLIVTNERVQFHSFRSDVDEFEGYVPQEVRIDFASKPKSIASKNVFSNESVVTFKRQGDDPEFSKTVNEKVFTLRGESPAKISKELARLFNSNELYSVSDDAIQDCRVLVRKKGKIKHQKTVYIFENGFKASRFTLENVALNNDKHPEIVPLKAGMLKVLKEVVIPKAKNV